MELIEFISTEVESFQLGNLTNRLEEQLWVDERRTGGKLVAGEVQFLQLAQLVNILGQRYQIVCR